MKDKMITQVLASAKHRGSIVATLFYKPGQDLEFIEDFKNWDEHTAARAFWKKMGYRAAYTWPLDI